jgi:leader peptidase (prepilin peptidase)/N-methyltransferase
MAPGQLLILIAFVLGGAVAIVAAIEDLRTHRLRDRHSAALAVFAVAGLVSAGAAGEAVPWLDVVLGAAIYAGPWLAAHLISPGAIGFGDIKLSAAIDLYLGWLSPSTALGALLVSSLAFVASSAVRRRPSSLAAPFGPALVGGAITAGGLHLAAGMP